MVIAEVFAASKGEQGETSDIQSRDMADVVARSNPDCAQLVPCCFQSDRVVWLWCVRRHGAHSSTCPEVLENASTFGLRWQGHGAEAAASLMNDVTLEVLDALGSEEPIARKSVLRWITERDLETRALVYRLTNIGWSRIHPEISMSEQCHFMAEYLFDCIALNSNGNDAIHSGFEAAWEFAAWLKHLDKVAQTDSLIADIVSDLEALYRQADAATRNRIETGAVEHIFEEKSPRKYFESWRDDPELKSAYAACAAWGDAHGPARPNSR